jgi:hypothetical protein
LRRERKRKTTASTGARIPVQAVRRGESASIIPTEKPTMKIVLRIWMKPAPRASRMSEVSLAARLRICPEGVRS